MKTITLQIRKVPSDLNQRLKVAALTRGMTLQAYVIQLLTDATKKGK